MKGRRGLVLLPLLLWVGAGVIWTQGCSAFTSFSAAALSPGAMPRSVPELAFLDDQGAPHVVGEATGRFTLVSFMYLRCPMVCHLGLAHLRDVARALEATTRDRLDIWSLSFDGDSPATLAGMRANLKLPENYRLGVLQGGPVASDDEALARFGALVRRREDGQYNHSTFFYLLDERARLVAVIPAEVPEHAVELLRKVLP